MKEKLLFLAKDTEVSQNIWKPEAVSEWYVWRYILSQHLKGTKYVTIGSFEISLVFLFRNPSQSS